jgi:hypothetical protein
MPPGIRIKKKHIGAGREIYQSRMLPILKVLADTMTILGYSGLPRENGITNIYYLGKSLSGMTGGATPGYVNS